MRFISCRSLQEVTAKCGKGHHGTNNGQIMDKQHVPTKRKTPQTALHSHSRGMTNGADNGSRTRLKLLKNSVAKRFIIQCVAFCVA